METVQAIQAIIGFPGKTIGAIVDIKENCIPDRCLGPDCLCHISFSDRDSRIIEWFACQMPEVMTIPPDHGWDQFAYGDVCILSGTGKCCRQGVTHAEPADEYIESAPVLQAATSEFRQCIFRAVQAAVHEFGGGSPDREFGSPFSQDDFAFTTWNHGTIQLFPGDHVCFPDWQVVFPTEGESMVMLYAFRPRDFFAGQPVSAGSYNVACDVCLPGRLDGSDSQVGLEMTSLLDFLASSVFWDPVS